LISFGINENIEPSAYISNKIPEIYLNTAVSRQMPSLKAVHNIVGSQNQKKKTVENLVRQNDSYEVNMNIKLP
jgi:hypothetical protein